MSVFLIIFLQGFWTLLQPLDVINSTQQSIISLLGRGVQVISIIVGPFPAQCRIGRVDRGVFEYFSFPFLLIIESATCKKKESSDM